MMKGGELDSPKSSKRTTSPADTAGINVTTTTQPETIMIPKGSKVHGEVGTKFGNIVGETTGSTRRCPLEGCSGVRVYVKWPDGHVTMPCTNSLEHQDDGSYRIG